MFFDMKKKSFYFALQDTIDPLKDQGKNFLKHTLGDCNCVLSIFHSLLENLQNPHLAFFPQEEREFCFQVYHNSTEGAQAHLQDKWFDPAVERSCST